MSDVIRIDKFLKALLEEFRDSQINLSKRSISIFEHDEFLSETQRNHFIESEKSMIVQSNSADFGDLIQSALVCAIHRNNQLLNDK